MTPVQRVFRWTAAILALLAIAPGYYAARLRWAPAADFDVTGVLWVLQNLPRLTAFTLTGLCLVGAGYFWVRSLRG
ncbi:MAG TPA: hypothetical protein VGA78_12525 [Gemmatimonadales bacterium]